MKMIKNSNFFNNLYRFHNLNKVDTLYLDNWNFYYPKKKGGKILPNLKEVIISKSLIKNNQRIALEEINAENIYIEGEENLGGLTFNSDIILKNNQSITIDNQELKQNFIKKINIICKDDIAKIELDNFFNNIYIEKYRNKIVIKSKSLNNERQFIVDELGNVKTRNKMYIIRQEDTEHQNLDLRKFINYEEVYFVTEINVDTLIVDNNVIKNMNIFKRINEKKANGDRKLNFNKLLVLENNDMKLFPMKNTFSVKKCLFGEEKKYIYLKTEENSEIVICLDDKDNIKIIDKEKIYKDSSVKNIEFKFIYHISNDVLSMYDIIANLILIEYNDGKYKFIELDKTYKVDNKLVNFLNYNSDKFFSGNLSLLKFKRDNSLFHLFNEETFTNTKLHKILKEYDKEIGRFDKLKELGFTEDAINYLIDRKINTIIEPNLDLNEISKKEIECYNEIGKEHALIKRKKLNEGFKK